MKTGAMHIFNRLQQSRIAKPGLVVLGFATVGVMSIFAAQAAVSTASFEVEAGNRASGASLASDSSASGGNAVKFGTSSSTGSCPQTKRTITASDVSSNMNSGYSSGTQVYVPDGPDPWGGCFPGTGTTGIQDGVTLTNYTGPCNITTANTTIEVKNITCSLTISANNVTIRNSRIIATDISVENSGSLLFEYNEVDFGDNVWGNGLVGYNFTVRKSDMQGGKRQIWCNNNCTLEDSYLHDQLSDPTGMTHESAARIEANTTFRHNTLLCNAPDYPPDAGCSANQTGYPDFAPIHDVILDRNFYSATSGGTCSYGGGSTGKPYSNDPLNATNIRSTDNVFQRGTKPNDRNYALTDKRRYTCGYYGVTMSYIASKSGFVFNGNMWDDGLLFSNDTTYPYSFTE